MVRFPLSVDSRKSSRPNGCMELSVSIFRACLPFRDSWEIGLHEIPVLQGVTKYVFSRTAPRKNGPCGAADCTLFRANKTSTIFCRCCSLKGPNREIQQIHITFKEFFQSLSFENSVSCYVSGVAVMTLYRCSCLV